MGSSETFGGNASLVSGPNDGTGQGVYSRFPGDTPRYHGGNDVFSVLQQARLFVTVADQEAYATLRNVIPQSAAPLFDVLCPQSGIGADGYFDFLLQSASEQRQEKLQVSEVLSDAYVAYFFGQRAPTWTYSGVLLNSQQDSWYDAWHVLYDQILRGSRLARLNLPARLQYNGRTVVGYLATTAEALESNNEMAVSLQFQMLVKRVIISNAFRPTNPGRGDSTRAPVSQEQRKEESQKQETVTTPTEGTEDLTGESPSPQAEAIGQAVASFGNSTTVRPGANAAELQSRLPAGSSISSLGPLALTGSTV